MAKQNSSFFDFLRALAAQWFSAMSGAASVPLAVAAYFIGNNTIKLALIATAVVCFVTASFQVWKAEREARLKAEYAILDQLNEFSHCLVITAEVVDEFLIKGKNLIGRIFLKNISKGALEYVPSHFRGVFSGVEPREVHGAEQILPAGESVYYDIRFDEQAMASTNGSVELDISTSYGPAGKSRIREINKKIVVTYTINNGLYVAQSAARDIEHRENPIGISK